MVLLLKFPNNTLVMAEFIENYLEERFDAAVSYLPTIVTTLKSDQLLKFYAFYKQATVGKCNTPSPYWYNFQSKQKWDAWKALGEMPQEEAMAQYVSFLDEILPGWEEENADDKRGKWVSVSTMLPHDSEIEENEKDIFDRVREGDVQKVKELLDIPTINELDENGMSLLHWAADRGQTEMVACLLDLGSDINLLDAAGQTALHYACCCGHEETVKLLLDKGAKTDITCHDGLTAEDLAGDKIKELF